MIGERVEQTQSGFGNEFASEAIPGTLPVGQNSPQRVALGLYAEGVSGTSFTTPRHDNKRTWMYRIRPTADHRPYRPLDTGRMQTAPLPRARVSPNRLRWNAFPIPASPADFVDGLFTIAANGDCALQRGIAIHLYAANRSMQRRAFTNIDGELLIVPQAGGLRLVTEVGRLTVLPGHIAVVPRGLKVRVELLDASARGYVCENYGALLRLPELGPIGSNGLANPRDFVAPVAAFEDRAETTELVVKFGGDLWTSELDHSPFDVVAWHGNYVPYAYDLARFNTMGSISFDHPDPSIYTVLTSPSDVPGVANVDFVIFPPRWSVMEHTFRPPWFHRNTMSEFMGLIDGAYDAKADGFEPGGSSLHNAMSAHGPDRATYDSAVKADLKPYKIDNGTAFMFESRYVIQPTAEALAAPQLQADYDACWNGFPPAELP